MMAWLGLGCSGSVLAQGGGLLSPPSLPSTLPGGGALPILPPMAQQEILQRLLEASANRPMPPGAPLAANSLTQPTPAPAAATAPPAMAFAPMPPPAPEPGSPAEAFFQARAEPGAPLLRQFGYDSLQPAPGNAPVGMSFGALPEDYVVGRDDEIVVAFRGRARASFSARVTRDGTLLLPDLAPIPAAGRTLRELRADLSARVARDLSGSEVYISIGQVRQVAIFVGGEVARPGMQALTAFGSVLDALVAAGGVKRTGSLRAIRVEGPSGRRLVDLYPVIAGDGAVPDLTLREGERILVPPLGGVVAMGGELTRPGIYELPGGGVPSLPLGTLLALAGEPMRPTGSRFLLQSTEADGRRSYREISIGDPVRRGDLLMVQPGADVVANQLRLGGHAVVPITRAAGTGTTSLKAMLADTRLVRPDPYPRLGVVWRTDAITRTRRFMPFDLGRVLAGRGDIPLREGDEVIMLSMADVLWLASPSVQQALRGTLPPQTLAGQEPRLRPPGATSTGNPPQGGPAAAPDQPSQGGPDCPALTQLAVSAQAAPQRYGHARGAGFPDSGRLTCPQVFIDYPALLVYLLDQTVLLTGEVRLPGLYPIVDNTGLDAVLAAAGGATDTVDLSVVEFAREPADQSATLPLMRQILDLRSRNFAAIRLSARDTVRLPRGFSDRDLGPVTLLGEFMRPGVYDIRRGERLSEVIARAGGLTPHAYPYGAIFTRAALRLRQQDGFRRTATHLEQSMLQMSSGQALSGQTGPLDLGGAVQAGRQLAQSLRNTPALGRMVVEANPVVLASRLELDVLLEPGDLIAMPKRPSEVTVVGAVLNSGSLQFLTGLKAGDYVRAAGGQQRFADGSRAFVVLPNGQSVLAGLGSWQFPGPPIPPGSMVVVPHDASPFSDWTTVREVTATLGEALVSASTLALLGSAAGILGR